MDFFVQSCGQLNFLIGDSLSSLCAPCLCLSIPCVLFLFFFFLKKKGEMLLYCLVVLGGFNCAAACTACSNPQTSCSTECRHKLVARMDWYCLWCLKHVDNLVSTEEKQILWRTAGGELISKDGRRRELGHCHKGTTKSGSIGLTSNSIARRVKNYSSNIYIVIY